MPSSEISGSLLDLSHSPGGYIAPDNRRSVIAASSDVKRDLTGSTCRISAVIRLTDIIGRTITNASIQKNTDSGLYDFKMRNGKLKRFLWQHCTFGNRSHIAF
jgi:hypothetical protein